MVKVTARARWFAKRAPEGIGRTRATFFGGRGGSRARLARRPLASGRPAGRAYLRHGLLVLGGVAAGILLGRRSKRGGTSPSLPSDIGGTGAAATIQTIPEPVAISGAPSEPTQGPAGVPGGEEPARRRPDLEDAVSLAPSSFAEPPRSEDLTERSVEDLDRALAESLPSGASSGEGAATIEEPPAVQDTQPPTEEAPSNVEELPPPPQASDADLPPSPQVSDEELPPPPQVSDAQLPPPPQASDEDLPPPPQASDVELPPPPQASDVAEELPPTEEAPSIAEELPPPPEVEEAELPPPPPAPQNAVDELPPPPVPEEQNVGDAPSPPDTEPSEETVVEEAPRAEGPRVRRVTATAAARRRARELGVDLLEVEGTGRDGKITVDDVRRRGEQTQS